MKGQCKQRLTKRKDQEWYKYEPGTTQWQIKKHCLWRDRKRTASESEMEPSLGDGRCAPSSFPSQCVSMPAGPLVAGVCLQASGPGPWYLHIGLTGSHATAGPLNYGGVRGSCLFSRVRLLDDAELMCVRRAFGSLHLFPHVYSLHSLLSARR